MALTDEPVDSPAGWVADHAHRYVETNGEDGYIWRGAPTLALTTTGRRSGQPRRTMLIFGRDGDNYIVVASKGGALDNPLWYDNIQQDPEVLVQVKGDKFHAHARNATFEEKPRLWSMMNEIWPSYNDYQAKTSRDIPVIVLEPEPADTEESA